MSRLPFLYGKAQAFALADAMPTPFPPVTGSRLPDRPGETRPEPFPSHASHKRRWRRHRSACHCSAAPFARQVAAIRCPARATIARGRPLRAGASGVRRDTDCRYHPPAAPARHSPGRPGAARSGRRPAWRALGPAASRARRPKVGSAPRAFGPGQPARVMLGTGEKQRIRTRHRPIVEPHGVVRHRPHADPALDRSARFVCLRQHQRVESPARHRQGHIGQGRLRHRVGSEQPHMRDRRGSERIGGNPQLHRSRQGRRRPVHCSVRRSMSPSPNPASSSRDHVRSRAGRSNADFALNDGASARQVIRSFIAKIVVQPGSARGGERCLILVRYSGVLRGARAAPTHNSPGLLGPRLFVADLVAGTGFEPVTFRL